MIFKILVRHGQYIPWDDDVDFVYFASDLEKLKQLRSQGVFTKHGFSNENSCHFYVFKRFKTNLFL